MLVPGSNRSIAAIALVSVSCTRSSALVLSRQNVVAKARSAGMRLTISGSGLPELVLLTSSGLCHVDRLSVNEVYRQLPGSKQRWYSAMVPALCGTKRGVRYVHAK